MQGERTIKGTVRLTLAMPLPEEVLGDIVRQRLSQVALPAELPTDASAPPVTQTQACDPTPSNLAGRAKTGSGGRSAPGGSSRLPGVRAP